MTLWADRPEWEGRSRWAVNLILTASILIPGTSISGQEFRPEFQILAGGAQDDRGVFVSPTRDGGYVAVGATESEGAGGGDIYLVRLEASGEVRWSRTHGGEGEDNGWSVLETSDGFAVAGFTDSYGAGGFDCYLIATDDSGNERWTRSFGGTGDDRCWALHRTSDGGYLLVGETTSMGAGAEDCFVVRTNDSGDELWSRAIGGQAGDRCFSVAATEDGGFLLAGQTYSEGAGDRDAYLIKIDSEGESQWTRTFGGSASDVAHSVKATGQGDFLAAGYTTSFATSFDDPYLIRIDSQGDTVWTRVLPHDGRARTITGEQTTDGGFMLTGTSTQADGNAALLVKVDSAGMVLWSRRVLPATAGQSFGYTVRATQDGGAVFTGHTTVGSRGGLDMFVIKVGPG